MILEELLLNRLINNLESKHLLSAINSMNSAISALIDDVIEHLDKKEIVSISF